MASGVKLTYEEVRDYFKQQGCKLLETEYKNARTKMRYRCKCGNEAMIVFDSFKTGNRCKKCGSQRAAEKQSLTHDEVAKYFLSQKCELLEQYTSSRTLVKYRCSCGNISTINWNNFKTKGRRCKQCGTKKRSGEGHYLWYNDRDGFKALCSFKDRCHKLVTVVLAAVGKVKNDTLKLLGYNYKQLQEHIQQHPNWENVKNGKWHVDHIFPIKAFLDHGISDLKIINALDNLRPIEATENMCKNAKYDKRKFYEWLAKKGITI